MPTRDDDRNSPFRRSRISITPTVDVSRLGGRRLDSPSIDLPDDIRTDLPGILGGMIEADRRDVDTAKPAETTGERFRPTGPIRPDLTLPDALPTAPTLSPKIAAKVLEDGRLRDVFGTAGPLVVAKDGEPIIADGPGDELTAVRRLMARAARGVETSILSDKVRRTFASTVLTQRPEFVDDVIAAVDKAPKTDERDPLSVEGARVFRREWPVHSAFLPGAAPRWAGGRRPDRTVGPFLDDSGRDVWFDVYLPIEAVSVTRGADTTPFLRFQRIGRRPGSGTRLRLTAGTVWMRADLFSRDAPADRYVGLVVSGGTLTFSQPPRWDADGLRIDPRDRVEMTLDLKDGQEPGDNKGRGADGEASAVDPPAKVVIAFDPRGAALTDAQPMKAVGLGVRLSLAPAQAPAVWNDALDRLVFPFKSRTRRFKPGRGRSSIAEITGEAEIVSAGWALPAAAGPANALGPAENSGGVLLELTRGLKARWQGLVGTASLNSAVLIEPGRLTVDSAGASAPGSVWRQNLWTSPDRGHASYVDVRANQPFRFTYTSTAGDHDAVVARCEIVGVCDRPLNADGGGNRFAFGNGIALVADTAAGILHGALGQDTTPIQETLALALKNALLTVSEPVLMFALGRVDSTGAPQAGQMGLIYAVHHVTPFLPDPYASNFDPPRLAVEDNRLLTHRTPWAGFTRPVTGVLFAALRWSYTGADKGAPKLELALRAAPQAYPAPLPRDPAELSPEDMGNEEFQDIIQQQAMLGVAFLYTSGAPVSRLYMLDVSTNADYAGVALTLGTARDDVKQPQTAPTHETVERRPSSASDGPPILAPMPPSTLAPGALSPFAIDDLALVGQARRVRLFFPPQFQWEPVVTEPNPTGFPTPLFSGDDGGPTVLGAPSDRIVPVAPTDRIEMLIEDHETGDGPLGTVALMTLPFGKRALAAFMREDSAMPFTAALDLNRPEAAEVDMTGGWQLSATALRGPAADPNHATAFHGATVQTRNARAPGAPTRKSVLGDSAGDAVETIFNGEMAFGGVKPVVPLERIDFAGYGASLYSDWREPDKSVGVSQVRFDAVTGRTAHEVVQVKSILYPWGVAVVRTITIERRKEGVVFRRDSGWMAASDGEFVYPAQGAVDTLHAHPGAVPGAYAVRRIRETGRVYEATVDGEDVKMAEIRFDADVAIDDVVAGGNGDGRVPSRDQTGFVQIEPVGRRLTADEFARLLDDEGPLGGPVDARIGVGGSDQIMKAVRVDVSVARPVAGAPEFAAAVRGGLRLPDDGSWAVVRQTSSGSAEPELVDPDKGVSLIRQGRKGTGPNPYYRFADPEDLLRAAAPSAIYGLLQAGEAHRVLYPTPKIADGGDRIVSDARPFFADLQALATRVGQFPARSFQATGKAELIVRGDGRYAQDPKELTFAVGPGQEVLDLESVAGFRLFAEYPTGNPSKIAFRLDPDDPVAWRSRVEDVYIGMDIGPFSNLLGTRSSFEAEDGGTPELVDPKVIYGSPLNVVVTPIIAFMELLGIDAPFGVSMTNAKPKMNAEVRINIVNPKDPEGWIDLGAISLKGRLGAGYGNDPTAMSNALVDSGVTGPPLDAGSSSAPVSEGWHGYFYVGLGILVPVFPPLSAGGEGEYDFVYDPKVGETYSRVAVRWKIELGESAGVVKLKAYFSYGIVVEFGNSVVGLGILVGISGTGSVLKGLVSVTVKLELMAIARQRSLPGPPPEDKWYGAGEAKLAIEVTVCWFLTLSFSIAFKHEFPIDL